MLHDKKPVTEGRGEQPVDLMRELAAGLAHSISETLESPLRAEAVGLGIRIYVGGDASLADHIASDFTAPQRRRADTFPSAKVINRFSRSDRTSFIRPRGLASCSWTAGLGSAASATATSARVSVSRRALGQPT